MTGYDIIGDIHGQAFKLKSLLARLGYKSSNGVYSHSDDRKIVFLGDFIDRGPNQREVINIVRSMIEAGNAYTVIGNHELNAIRFHRRDPKTGELVKAPSERDIKNHKEFLDEYPEGEEETMELIDWFKSLPLFLELDNLCFIHACWDKNLIKVLEPYLDKENRLTEEGFREYFIRGSEVKNAVNTLLKGPKFKLPDDIPYEDAFGVVRTKVRYKWWGSNFKTYYDAAVDKLAEKAKEFGIDFSFDVDDNIIEDSKILFFGHYWFSGTPKPLRANMACVDYSAGKKDYPLVAYRWNINESSVALSADNFIKSHD